MRRCRAWVVSLVVGVACGGTPPPRAAPAAVDPADAAPPADAGWIAPADAGPAAPRADAGLVDIGFAACDALLARILACPGIPRDSKLELAETANRWRREAGEGAEAREAAAAACIDAARQGEEFLLPLGC